MKKRITIVTATRAEYGLLKPVILGLIASDEFDVRVVATGAHLSQDFGMTYREIENDGITIDEKIEILLGSDSPSAITKSMGLALFGFADYFHRVRPDLLILLGDRYETLAIAQAAMNEHVPIAHLYGGETTEGALDENIRHAITKLSYLHFTSTEEYRRRVIQLGEDPSRVFTVGALGVENILHEDILSKSQLAAQLETDLSCPFGMVTFHPTTLENNSAKAQIEEILAVVENHPELFFIVTKANADADGRIINSLLDSFAQHHQNIAVFASLGMKRYLSALKHCEFVLGNSSSGLIEAPSFHVPVINVGDRQKGRLQAECVLNCEPERSSIEAALNIARSDSFQRIAQECVNPYGNGDSSRKIIQSIREVLSHDKIDLKKHFFDLEEGK